jgi:hypothetical protein
VFSWADGTTFVLAVEIGNWQRLTGRSIGAYLMLVPSESSSGYCGLKADHHNG